MQGLVDVGDKMHQELEGLNAIGSRLILVGEDPLKYLNPVNYTVVVVVSCFRMLFVGPIAIALLRETAGIHGNIHKMPTEGFGALGADFVRPGGDGGEVIIAQQFTNVASSGRGQV